MANWTIYLLCNTNCKRTYIGCTTNLIRRLRQHNREIKGGAKATKWGAPNWQVYCFLTNFKDRSSAMRWERILKSRFRGFDNRAAAFAEVGRGECPGKGKYYPVPDNIRYDWRFLYE